MGSPSKATLKKKLDKLVGRHCRSRGICQAYLYSEKGKEPRPCTPQLQWSHIKSRRYLSVRWSENNYLCLCAGHHAWFTANPDKFGQFLQECFPDQLERLEAEFKEVSPMKNSDLSDLYNKLLAELEP